MEFAITVGGGTEVIVEGLCQHIAGFCSTKFKKKNKQGFCLLIVGTQNTATLDLYFRNMKRHDGFEHNLITNITACHVVAVSHSGG